MSIESEVDTLLIAARQAIYMREETVARVAALQQELKKCEVFLREAVVTEKALTDRISIAGVRHGYVSAETLKQNPTLSELEHLFIKGMMDATTTSASSNVVPIGLRKASNAGPATDVRRPEQDSLWNAVHRALALITKERAELLRYLYTIEDDGKPGSNPAGRSYARAARAFKMKKALVIEEQARGLRELRHPSRSVELRAFEESVDPKNLRSGEERLMSDIFGLHSRDAVEQMLAQHRRSVEPE